MPGSIMRFLMCSFSCVSVNFAYDCTMLESWHPPVCGLHHRTRSILNNASCCLVSVWTCCTHHLCTALAGIGT